MTGLLRVKNEARWIERCLASILPLCEKILVMDDHSEDNTPFLCASFPRVQVFDSPFTGLNETRDKNWLLEKAQGDWMLMIDGDEMLAPGAAEVLEGAVNGAARALSLPILYLWDHESQVRGDGVYGRFWRPSVFLKSAGYQFTSTSAGGNFHCGNTPLPLQHEAVKIMAPLLHFGYMLREDRIRKYHWYNSHDPRNGNEDGYRHIVQGDVPEVPASAHLMHAGPLKLEALCSRFTTTQ